LLWGARIKGCEELSTSFGFCLSSIRGEQAFEVKRTPEALRQAIGATMIVARGILRYPGAILRKLALIETRGKRLVSSARRVTPLEKGENKKFCTVGLLFFTDGSE